MIFIVDQSDAKTRLDKYISDKARLGRSEVARLLKNEQIHLDYLPETKGFLRLKANQKVEIFLEPKKIEDLPKPKQEPPKLEIIYEDDDFRVYNKPYDLLTHADGRTAEYDLVNLAREGIPVEKVRHTKDIEDKEDWELAPTVCHRLDRDTSGAILYAKHKDAIIWGKRLFQKKLVKKTYLTIVFGKVPESGVINAPISRKENSPTLRQVSKQKKGRDAETYFFLRGYNSEYDISLVECNLITGRTHQIRVHMAYIGHPVVGDKSYGNFKSNREIKANRQMLHSWKLSFYDMKGKMQHTEANLYKDMLDFMEMYNLHFF